MIAVLGATSLSAQTTADIRGRVADETDAALPGVSVIAKSPALLVPQLVSVSDAEGKFAFPALPIGNYRLEFELSGFQRLVRDEVVLRAGFTATINVTLKVGALEESITVAGASPVVDVTATTPSTSLNAQVLTEVIPATRTLQDFLATTAGVQPGGRSDLGGGTPSGGSYSSVYGVSGQITNLIEGVSTRQGAGAPGTGPDLASLEELQVVAIAGSAEQALPGVAVNMIVKSGGNAYHGKYEAFGQHSKFQSDNLTDELRAQGVTLSDGLRNSYEINGDLGGRIIRDRLWFYGALRQQRADRNSLGFLDSAGPDGIYLTPDDVPGSKVSYLDNQTLKGTFQATPKNKIIGFYTRNGLYYPKGFAGRTVPYENTTTHYNGIEEFKGELQSVPSSRLVFNAQVGLHRYNNARYEAQTGFDNIPTTFDNATQMNWGPSIFQYVRPRRQVQYRANASFFPESRFMGRHELKAGVAFDQQYQGDGAVAGRHGNYQLIVDTINGVPRQPFQFRTYNYPVLAEQRLNEGGAFVQDTWAVNSRLTLNLGFRLDTFHSWLPPQTKQPSQFGTSGSFPEREVGSWQLPAPRFGAIYQLTGDGKTVVKVSYGRYNHTPGDDFAQAYNPNSGIITTYRWRDLNGNGDYDPGEVNLDTNGPDFVSITGQVSSGSASSVGAVNILDNPDLTMPRTHQATVSLERELFANFAGRFGYYYVRQRDLIEVINARRPYSAYNVPLSLLDPGPDGRANTADDAGFTTVWDYDAAYRGSNFVASQRVNRPDDRDQWSHTLEAVLTRRTSERWGMMGTVAFEKNHRWLVGVVQSPNDEYFPIDETWSWQGKLTGNYQLPWALNLSGTFQIYNGIQSQRTYLFRGLPSLGTVTIRREPYGAIAGTERSLLNLRIAKDVWRAGSRRLRLSLEGLNVLNGASPWGLINASGATYGYYTSVDSPRILRFGAMFAF
jgi:hypothetical protein